MFVDIENFKSVLAIENILIPYKRGRLASDKKSYLPKEPITPDICWEVLRSTNAPRSIENMLSCIADLPPSEQAQFKEVVLSTFDNREQPDKQPHNIVLLGKKLAVASGYEAELAEVQKPKEGYFLFSSPYLNKSFVTFKNSIDDDDFSSYDRVVFLSSEKIQFGGYNKFPKNMEFPNSSDVYLMQQNFQGVQSMSFKDGVILTLNSTQNLPPQLDFSHCSEVNLIYCDLANQSNLSFKDGAKVNLRIVKNLPANIDFSRCDKVSIDRCDLFNQSNLAFKDGAIVDLIGIDNLPSQLDVSHCSEVSLGGCDLANQPNLCFKDGAIVNLSYAENLAPNLDFSRCSEVNLSGCDFANQPNPIFKDGAKVNLSYARNLPPQLDLSHCSEVELTYCDLQSVQSIRFKDDAIVYLSFSENLPSKLDFSRCSKVDLSFCNLSNVEHLIFKNQEQQSKFRAAIPSNWKGKIIYTDEQPQNDLNLAMAFKTKGGR